MRRRRNVDVPPDASTRSKTTKTSSAEIDNDAKSTQASNASGSDLCQKEPADSTAGTSKKEEVRAPPSDDAQQPSASTYSVARCIMIRLVGFVYLVAFCGAYNQNVGLFGSQGLVPAHFYMERLFSAFPKSNWQGFLSYPTLFWWIPVTDINMQLFAVLGILLSLVATVGWGKLREECLWLVFIVLWLLNFSVVTIAGGTSFYSYGWESQLLETGFLTIFLCRLPFIDNNKQQQRCMPSTRIILWLFQWLCFRISIGAGLIKVRGSSCWTEKTCLFHHFETQPIPSPLSFAFHFLPTWVLTRAVDLDLWVQVYTAWFVLVPKKIIRRIGGFAQAGFMVNIILSGNFAFLNHITIVPALACLDDGCWPMRLVTWVKADQQFTTEKKKKRFLTRRVVLDVGLLLLIGYLSIPVITNLWGTGGRQAMNASFDPFRLVNTYGAFGSVGEARYEPILAVSSNGANWTELEFPCKPGKVTRRPCFCAPYHYRLDWNIWFIGFKPHARYLRQRESWLYALLAKILDNKHNDKRRPWMSLLDKSASDFLEQEFYSSSRSPRYAKVDMYHYRMAQPLWRIIPQWLRGDTPIVWWNRTLEESLVPVVELNSSTQRLQLAET